MAFAERLKELRLENKMSQKALANLLNVDQTTIKCWEKGNNETDFTTLIKISNIFEVSVDYLIGKTDTY